jgi:two-component system LytT family response regulator
MSPTTPGASRGLELRAPLTLAGREERGAAPLSFGRESAAPGPAADPYLDRIVVRSRSRILFLDVREVTWLEAYGNYVRFHTPQEVYTVRGTLTSFEQQLDPARFLRIHRSMIVNREVVRELHSRRTGDFTLVTHGGEKLTLSRNFRNRVPELRRLLAS